MAASRARRFLESGESSEFFKALIDVFAGQGTKTLHAELFATETTHYGTINHGPMQFMHVDIAVLQIEAPFRQVANESARETVARARRIEYVFQEIARNHKQRVTAE